MTSSLGRMRYAVISDIHANAEALGRVLRDAAAARVDQLVCLGDVVGYGPMPVETIALLRESAAVVIAGNHDDAVAGRIDASDFIELAGDAVCRHRQAIGRNGLEWLKSLPHTAAIEGALLAHGDFVEPQSFCYVDSEEEAAANFAATSAQLMFVGHTHKPAIFVTGGSGKAYQLDAQDFTLEEGKRYIVNPGSVGYPRETRGKCCSSYIIYDSAAKTIEFKELPFSVASVMQRGTGPRKRWMWALVGGAVLAALGGAAVLTVPRTVQVEIAAKTKVQEPKEEDSLIIAEQSVTIGNSASCVRANLKIDPASGPAILRIVFKSADGKDCGETVLTVKKSSKQKISVQGNAVSAHFAVMKPHLESSPRVLSFKPTAGR